MSALKRLFSRKSKEQSSNMRSTTVHQFGEGRSGEAEDASPAVSGRRKFLLKCGKYTAYTAPVIYTLLAPKGSIYAASGSETTQAPN